MRVSRVGGVVVWLVTFARIRASAKARLLDDPDYPNQQAKQTNKKKNRNDMLNALPVLEDSVSLYY